MNKRDLLLGGTAALAVCVLLPASARAVPASTARILGRLRRHPDLLGQAGLEAWRRYVGEAFEAIRSPGAPVLVLRRVVQQHAAQAGEQFSLLFAATPNRPGHAVVQRLRSRSTGQQIPVYLQAAGRDADGVVLYRADFNRLG